MLIIYRFFSNFNYLLPTDREKVEENRSSTILGQWFNAKPHELSTHMNEVSKNLRIALVFKGCKFSASKKFCIVTPFLWNLKNLEFVFKYIWKIFCIIFSASLICSFKASNIWFKTCINNEHGIIPKGMNIGSWGWKRPRYYNSLY